MASERHDGVISTPMTEFRDAKAFTNLPAHVAFILDGNGRWATAQNMARSYGHHQGGETVNHIYDASIALGLRQITLYVLSTENLKSRPVAEVACIQTVITNFLLNNQEKIVRDNTRLITIGHPENCPSEKMKQVLNDAIESTKHNTGMVVCMAINYGSRQEIVDAAKAFANDVQTGRVNDLSSLTEASFADYLYQRDMPEPDLMIRTAGEYRLSNYLLWQIAYAEMYITKVLWPDFNKEELYVALYDYEKRKRTKGGLTTS